MASYEAMDMPCMAWGDLISTGIDDRQLRGAMTRGLISLGKKRHGKMLYTLRERFTVDLIGALTHIWVPISTACAVGSRVGAQLDAIYAYHAERIAPNDPARLNFDMRLIVGNAGEDLAIGLRLNGDGRLPAIPNLPLVKGDLHVQIEVSLTELFRRHLRFCLEQAEQE